MKQMTIRIDDETYEKLAYTGDHLGIATATVARIWLKQRADETYMPPRKPQVKKSSQSSSKQPPTVRRKNPEGTRAERRSKKSQEDPTAKVVDDIREVSRWEKK
jgi:antitoxin component of RelBE/YafQ-DinJ toxin-antitoxin module